MNQSTAMREEHKRQRAHRLLLSESGDVAGRTTEDVRWIEMWRSQDELATNASCSTEPEVQRANDKAES